MNSLTIKNTIRVLLLLVPLILLINLKSQANGYLKNKQKINHGIRNGSLSRQEANKLIQQNEQLKFMIRRAKADGIVTRREKLRIRNYKKQLDFAIHKEKNDWFFM